MSRCVSLLSVVALLVVCCAVMQAQVDHVFEVSYFDNNVPNAAVGPGTLYILNPGLTGSPISSGDNSGGPPPPMAPVLQAAVAGPVMTFEGILCANIYVFDDSQEMLECCSCPLTANGPLIIPIEELVDNPLTVYPFRGVIKIVSTAPNPLCDPTDLSQPVAELRSFATHLQNAAFGGVNAQAALFLTEAHFAPAPLSPYEQSDLAQICSFVRYLGTGRGRCDDACTAVTALP